MSSKQNEQSVFSREDSVTDAVGPSLDAAAQGYVIPDLSALAEKRRSVRRRRALKTLTRLAVVAGIAERLLTLTRSLFSSVRHLWQWW